ncbi:MAG TPA: SAM-dependent methyltransferase [Mycobacteriales bacterium]
MEQRQQRFGVPARTGMNAVGAAAVRAAENRRGDRLFTDPLAEAFVAAAGRPWRFPAKEEAAAAPFWTMLADTMAVRTRFFDEYLALASATGIRQVVVLAAGLDTRAYRLPWPRTVRLWELDRPDVVRFKEQVLTATGALPACRRMSLGTDLRGDWPAMLRRGGFDPDQPTAWLVEGLLVYLTAAEADLLLGRVGELSTPDSRLGLSVAGRAMLDPGARPAVLDALGDYSARVGTAWRSGFSADPTEWLAGHGWTARTYDPVRRGAAYGRRIAGIPGAEPGSGLGWLAVAERAA